MKAKYQKGGRLTKKRDKLTGKLDTLNSKVGTKFVKGKTGPTGVTTENHIEVPDYTKKSQKRKSKSLTKRIDKLGNRIYKKANKKKFTPVGKKALNAFLQKGGEKETPRYWNTAFDHEKTTRSANLKPPLYNEYKGNTKTVRYKESDNVEGGSNTYTQPPAGTTYNKYTDSSEMPEDSKKMKKTKNQFPIDRRKGGKRYQKGGMTKKAPATIPQRETNPNIHDPRSQDGSLYRSIKRDVLYNKPGTERNKADEDNQQRVKDRSLKKQRGGGRPDISGSRGRRLRTMPKAKIPDYFNPISSNDPVMLEHVTTEGLKGVKSKKKQKGGEYGKRHDRLGKRRDKLDDKAFNTPVSNNKRYDRLEKRRKKVVEKRRDIRAKKDSNSGFRYTMQKGGKVKPSLQYNPNYPTTQNKPSPHSKLKLDKAIARDSTSIANRWPIADFFDDGTENSTSRKLQVNREYRDKVNNADSKTTAKKINKMKSKKQMGGSVAERMRNAKGPKVVRGIPTPSEKMTGQETKDLGKKKLAAGRANRRTARNTDGGAKSIIKSIAKSQRQEGRGLKRKGRKMKRSDRQDKKEAEVERTRSWLQTGGSKEVVFGAPKKDKASPRKTLRQKQTEGNRQFDESMKRKIAEERGVRGREKRTRMQKGGARNKKQLGGLMGAIGGAKNGGGIGGAFKGLVGGGVIGRGIGAVKGAMGGGGLKGAMDGFKGGAFGNSNPMAQAPQEDQAAQQMAQRGGFKRFKAKQKQKKALRKRRRNSGKIYGNKNSNCYDGGC